MKIARAAFVLFVFCGVACSRPAPPSGDPSSPKADASAAVTPAASSGAAHVAPPANATLCPAVGSVQCLRFGTAEDAFKHVITIGPIVLAVGEAHAQKGTEGIASSTKRFTDAFLPLLAGKASDIVVELWAPDPKCMKANPLRPEAPHAVGSSPEMAAATARAAARGGRGVRSGGRTTCAGGARGCGVSRDRRRVARISR